MVAKRFHKAHFMSRPVGDVICYKDGHFVGAIRRVAASFKTSGKGHAGGGLTAILLGAKIVRAAFGTADGHTNAVCAGDEIGFGRAGLPKTKGALRHRRPGYGGLFIVWPAIFNTSGQQGCR